MPDVTTGMWTVFFNAAPDEDAGESGQMPIDGREGDARQYEEDGDFTESQWADRQPQLLVNVLADFAVLQSWPTGSAVTLDVFESEAVGAILVHSETISAPGPYYLADMDTDLGGDYTWVGVAVSVIGGTLSFQDPAGAGISLGRVASSDTQPGNWSR